MVLKAKKSSPQGINMKLTTRTIVIGASAGGIEVISNLLALLPSNLNACLFIVIHLPSGRTEYVHEIFSRKSNLPVVIATDSSDYHVKKVYLAPADHHLYIDKKKIKIVKGPKINSFRPSIDITFSSAALSLNKRLVGVLLTGLLSDGVQGIEAIKAHGGITIAQSPEEAQFSDMPLNAISGGFVDYICSIAELAKLLIKLSANKKISISSKKKNSMETDLLLKGGKGLQTKSSELTHKETISAFTCPDCNGTLWEVKYPSGANFRCRTGHQYNLESMEHQQDISLENILWSAVRALEESCDLSLKIANEMSAKQLNDAAKLYFNKSKLANMKANRLREIIQLENLVSSKASTLFE